MKCPSRGEPASRLASASHGSVYLWYTLHVWRQPEVYIMVQLEELLISVEIFWLNLPDCVSFSTFATAFNIEIILLLERSRPLLHAVSLGDPSRKSFSAKETGSKGHSQRYWAKRLIPIAAAIGSELDADICESLKCSCPVKHQGMKFFHTEHSFLFCFSDGTNQVPRFK